MWNYGTKPNMCASYDRYFIRRGRRYFMGHTLKKSVEIENILECVPNNKAEPCLLYQNLTWYNDVCMRVDELYEAKHQPCYVKYYSRIQVAYTTPYTLENPYRSLTCVCVFV